MLGMLRDVRWAAEGDGVDRFESLRRGAAFLHILGWVLGILSMLGTLALGTRLDAFSSGVSGASLLIGLVRSAVIVVIFWVLGAAVELICDIGEDVAEMKKGLAHRPATPAPERPRPAPSPRAPERDSGTVITRLSPAELATLKPTEEDLRSGRTRQCSSCGTFNASARYCRTCGETLD